MKRKIVSLVLGVLLFSSIGSPTSQAQSPAGQPPAKLTVDSPLPNQLAKGVVVIPFRTENVRIMQVFGRAALAISPRIGHFHLTLDDNPWVWGHFSDQEIIVADLLPGPHKIRVQLVNANHETLAEEVVRFEIPRRSITKPGPKAGGKPRAEESPAKLIVDPPQPDLLKLGVALIRYRTENLQIAPLFGPAALAISPRVGHLHVTLDDAPWHWADASGQPIDVGYLSPGRHKILIELADANHEVLAREVVQFEVPSTE